MVSPRPTTPTAFKTVLSSSPFSSVFFSLDSRVHLADHYADDLEVELEAAMLDDFGAQLEDGSPREVRLKLFLSCLVFLADGG